MGRADLRPLDLRRSWLFVPGADDAALKRASASGADVLIQELEDFTLPADRPKARANSPAIMEDWKTLGAVAAVRINPLSGDGLADLEAVMAGRPDAVMLPKSNTAEEINALDERIGQHERDLGIPIGSTEIVPNVELARGLVETVLICRASKRVSAALVAAEDMAADLGCERQPDMSELVYVRQRFLIDCRAACVLPIDMPFTWSDIDRARAHVQSARRLGYTAKSAVNPDHVRAINEELSPSQADHGDATAILKAFDDAKRQGMSRVLVDGRELELPHLKRATDILERYERFARFDASQSK